MVTQSRLQGLVRTRISFRSFKGRARRSGRWTRLLLRMPCLPVPAMCCFHRRKLAIRKLCLTAFISTGQGGRVLPSSIAMAFLIMASRIRGSMPKSSYQAGCLSQRQASELRPEFSKKFPKEKMKISAAFPEHHNCGQKTATDASKPRHGGQICLQPANP